jgi:hypothetical protein
MFPPGANADPAVLVTDAAGDANFLNAQSLAGSPPNGPSTKPASIDGADLREISFETRYTTSKFLNPDGSVSKILYTANALKIHVTMEGNIQPTAGPSFMLRIPTRVVRPTGGVCEAWFEAFWKGSRPAPGDIERADIRRLTAAPACPAVNTLLDGFDLVINGKTMTMIYPLTSPNMAGFIEDGTEIQAPQVFINNPNYVHLRLQAGAPAVPPATTGPTIVTSGQVDDAAIFPGFTVASDVPADIDCTVTPDHAECV